MITLFPFAEYWPFYLAFTGFVIVLIALDLFVFHRKPHAVSMGEATAWSVVWIVLALVFNYAFWRYAQLRFASDARLLAAGVDPEAAARQAALEFLTGYLMEKSLSVDNIFVFVLVFRYFGIPPELQHRVLFLGILGALVFRAIFIAMGAALIQYHWVVVLFGIFLVFTGIKMLFGPDQEIRPERNPLIRLLRRYLPVTPALDGQRFLTRIAGKIHATPLLVTLLFIETSDIVFAIDSVPAIFAITHEPMIVFTANVFAILGLRALYFLLAGAVHLFHMLKYGLAVVLVFVGLKMAWLNQLFGGKFPTENSLGIIGVLIALSIAASLAFPRQPADKPQVHTR